MLLIGYDTECKLDPKDKDMLFGSIPLILLRSIVALKAMDLKYFGLISFLPINDFDFENVPSDMNK